MPEIADKGVGIGNSDPALSLLPLRRLSREEVQRKYAPRTDKDWTAEREAAFFAALPLRTASTRAQRRASAWLVQEYAREVLGACRVSAGYTSTLSAVLGAFAMADEAGNEVRISQRMAQYGTPQTLRTIQTQMERAGVLARVVREQGAHFVGEVYVYSPPPTVWSTGGLEAAYRACERGPAAYSDLALAHSCTDAVPF